MSPSPRVSCCRWHAWLWLGKPRRGSASSLSPAAFQLPGNSAALGTRGFLWASLTWKLLPAAPRGGFSPRGALCWAILNIQIHFYACTVLERARLPLWHANEPPSAARGLSRGTRPSPSHFPQVAPCLQGGVGGARGSFLRLPQSFLHLLLSGRREEGSCCFLHRGK